MIRRSSDQAPLILAIDLGTSALKAGICGADGLLHGAVTVPLAPVRSEAPGWAEADAREWPEALRRASALLAEGGGVRRVAAVVVSGHGPSLVAVDREGEPLRPALLWLDRRAGAESEEVSRRWGMRIEPWHFLPKALWLARHEPAVYERAAHLLSCPELLIHRLTGVACTMLHTEAFRHYYWREDVVEGLGLETAKLPPFVAPGERIGELLEVAAEDLGLPTGIPVVAGGPDFLVSLIGTKTVAPGRVCDRAGSSEGINLCAAREVSDPALQCQPHAVKPYWNVAGTIPASGLAVDWIRSVSGRSREPYEAVFEELAAVPAGAEGLLFVPFLGAEGRGALLGLDLRHGPAHMVRAVVESVGFAIRDVLLTMRATGLPVGHMTVTGGQARLDRWSQIKADITGVEIRVPRVPEAEIVGGAAVGLVSLGEFASLAEAAEAMVGIEKSFAPDPSVARLYEELHARYRELRSRL